jgi:hypothetical protein
VDGFKISRNASNEDQMEHYSFLPEIRNGSLANGPAAWENNLQFLIKLIRKITAVHEEQI